MRELVSAPWDEPLTWLAAYCMDGPTKAELWGGRLDRAVAVHWRFAERAWRPDGGVR
jgi:hypothetical protein